MNPTILPLIGALSLTVSARAEVAATDSPYKARDFGDQGDRTTMDTETAQKAIDTCVACGGSTVYFGPGISRAAVCV
jgi:polygalacturonase